MILIEQFRSLENHNFELNQIDNNYIIARHREYQIHILQEEGRDDIGFNCIDYNEDILTEFFKVEEIEEAIKKCIEAFNY